MRCVGDGYKRAKDVTVEREPVEREARRQSVDVGHLAIEREIFDVALRHTHPTHVVRGDHDAFVGHALPRLAEVASKLHLEVAPDVGREDHWHAVALADYRVSNVRAVAAADILDVRLHHAPLSLTAQTLTASPTPFNSCSPLSSNRTPADVRANDRTVSETSTSPGADSPLMREAMLTAPP